MGQGTNVLFNIVAVIFLVAPADTPLPPTQMVLPTLTPSPVPGAALTPDMTPTPEAGSQ
jgi:hypothetical protein